MKLSKQEFLAYTTFIGGLHRECAEYYMNGGSDDHRKKLMDRILKEDGVGTRILGQILLDRNKKELDMFLESWTFRGVNNL